MLQTTMMEALAVVLALAYLALAIKRNIGCWAAAAISTTLYLFIFLEVKLYAEALLQIFYLIMAGYGFLHWRKVDSEGLQPVVRWSSRQHVLALGLIGLASLGLGHLLSLTDAAWPLVDAFTTCASLVATWMVARRVLDNWVYWLVIDSISILLYLERALFFTACLFAIYIIMIFFGWRSWTLAYRAHTGQNTRSPGHQTT